MAYFVEEEATISTIHPICRASLVVVAEGYAGKETADDPTNQELHD